MQIMGWKVWKFEINVINLRENHTRGVGGMRSHKKEVLFITFDPE